MTTDGKAPRLVTPIYVKTRPDTRAPDDDACYYMLTRSGLFIGRNTAHVASLVPARQCPGELEPQKPQLDLRYPKVPAALVARITAFFWTIAARHGGEAVVLLAFDQTSGVIRPIVPPQLATVGTDWRGQPYPIGLHYQIPPLPGRNLRLFGDIHSHAFDPAYASTVDVRDEQHWPGLHVVAGRLDQDPPRWHAEYVVDGTRFDLAPDSVMDLDAYRGRSTEVDDDWVSRVRVESGSQYRHTLTGNGPDPYPDDSPTHSPHHEEQDRTPPGRPSAR